MDRIFGAIWIYRGYEPQGGGFLTSARPTTSGDRPDAAAASVLPPDGTDAMAEVGGAAPLLSNSSRVKSTHGKR